MSNTKDWHIKKGNTYKNNGEFKEAIECYEKAVEIDPKDAFVWYNMGIAHKALKKYEKAIECYEKVVEIDPKYAKAWSNMGNTYDDLKKFEKAIECYEKAVKIDPNYIRAQNNLKNLNSKLKYKNNRKYRIGKEICAIKELGIYKIILHIENIGDITLQNLTILDKVPDNFEYSAFSMEPEIVDEYGSDTLKFNIEKLGKHEKLDVSYEIEGSGEYLPHETQLALL